LNYLFDTCIISDLRKSKPDKNLLNWINSIHDEECYISVITVGEIYKGISKVKSKNKKRDLTKWIENIVQTSEKILDVNIDICKLWGAKQGQLEAKGINIQYFDGLLAATAKYNDLQIVTRNTKDFDHFDIAQINPYIDISKHNL